MAIDYSSDTLTAHIEVHLETVRDSIRMQNILLGWEKIEIPAEDVTAAWLYYPQCVSTSTGSIIADGKEISVKELGFEQFMNLPGPLFNSWLQKVYEINPHFLTAIEKAATSEGDTEKKSK